MNIFKLIVICAIFSLGKSMVTLEQEKNVSDVSIGNMNKIRGFYY